MVVALYAGLLTLMYVGLTFYTIAGRIKYRVSLGDGGSEDLSRRVRAHGNFVEYVPLALILLFIAEQESAADIWLHVWGVVLVAGRIFHALAINNASPIPYSRQIGMVLTLGVLTTSALHLIAAYL